MMSRVSSHRSLAITLNSLLGFAACWLAAADLSRGQSTKRDVVWLEGQAGTVSGEVKSVKPEQIVMEVAGKPQGIPVAEISRLRLGDDPTGMAAVRAAVQAGQYEQASKQLESVKAATRTVTKQDVAYHRVLVAARLALQGNGKINDAAREVGSFIKNYPDSFRYYQACELMGDLAMSLGRYATAASYFAKIGQSSSKALAARGKLLEGDAWLRQDEYAKAAALFRLALQAEQPRLKSLASVGLAVCLAEAGKPQEAMDRLEQVIQQNDSKDYELFAKTYNALGRAYRLTNQTEAALDAYLHTQLLFYRDQQAHAEALYHLTQLWADLNNPSESRKARQTLQTRFTSSPWAKK